MKIVKTKSYNVALLGILTAVALVLSFLESLIPAASFMPPGAKVGFSNLAVMVAASSMGLAPALAVAALKSLFVFLTRGATAFFMSFAGGVLSTATMYLLFKLTKKMGYVEIGILSALMHNAGQLAVAAVLVGNSSVIGYAPVLIIAALLSGAATGAILGVVLPKLQILKNSIHTKGGK